MALLEKHAEERAWELHGGFRFSRGGAKSGGKSSSSASLHDLELPTVSLSLKWLSALIELLRSKTSTTMAVGGGSFLSVVRVEGQIRVIRIHNSVAGKEVWLQFDDVVLEVREQAKLYLAVANRIEQVLERRESQLADKQRKDAAQKRKAISNKLQTAAFTSMLDTLHGLLAGCSTDFPALSRRFHDQEAHLAAQRRRVKEENQDMTNIFFTMIPANLLEANFKHITAKLEPEQPSVDESASSSADSANANAAASTAEGDKTSEQHAPAKKLSKKEAAAAAAAAAAAEAERKKQAEADAEAARKEAEKVRREKQEKFAALQLEQKRKQLSANPFTHLEGFSENSAAALEAEQEQAKEHQIKKAAEAKTKQQEREAEETRRAAHEAEAQRQARAAKTSAAHESVKKQVVDEAKKATQRESEEKRKATQREAEEKKRLAAERAANEKAAADKKKAEKAERAAAEKAVADKKKAEKATASSSSPSSSPSASSSSHQESSKAKNVPGPDRSEKQRKAEKIEAAQKEKQRKSQMTQIAGLKTKQSNQTMLYAGIAGGVVVALIIAMVLMNTLQGGSAAF